ncbi:MAG: FecR domain-containing protein [Tannerella sp.]|jgi:ferric-dicitrate binding protein FerR (iron transport regulator)|nr:FecR domain-containing protein [Tannerella sp.]
MKYKSTIQNARKKVLLRKQLSEREKAAVERDFSGRDYDYYLSAKDGELLLPEKYSADATFQKIKRAMRYGISRRRMLKYAAAVALLLAAAAGVYRFSGAPEEIRVSTSYGERRQLRLPDGSTVILNSLSSVSYAGNIHRGRVRQITLDGEAYFDVAKDARRPFTVKASGVEVRALGTRFNVSAYGNDGYVAASLYEGSVSVAFGGRGDTLLLKPGEQAVCSKTSGRAERAALDGENRSAWITGSMYFENTRLKDIFKILEREKNVSFLVTGGINTDVRITAKFSRGESLEEILTFLGSPGGFAFEKNENAYIIKKQEH